MGTLHEEMAKLSQSNLQMLVKSCPVPLTDDQKAQILNAPSPAESVKVMSQILGNHFGTFGKKS
jgi:hypothetical protein